MTVSYIFDEDLLRHLEYADGAVNLVATQSEWTMGLSKAYAEKFPKAYESFLKMQEDYSIRLGKVFAYDEPVINKTLYNLPVKTLAKDWGDKDVLKESLEYLGKHIKGPKDIITPITIVGDLKESIEFMEKALGVSEDVHYWVGISTKRAKDNKFDRDKLRIYISAVKGLDKDKIKKAIEDYLINSKLKLENVKFITTENNRDLLSFVKEGDVITYPFIKGSIPRIVHFSDLALIFKSKDEIDLKLNKFIQYLRKNNLDTKCVDI